MLNLDRAASSAASNGRRRVLLMRHGAVDYFDAAGRPVPADSVGLTPAGWAQAQAAGRLLKEAGAVPDQVVTSGLLRTRQTADAVLQAAGLGGARRPVLVEVPELAEIRAGHLASIPDHEIDAAFTSVFDHPPGAPVARRTFLDGERLDAFVARVGTAVAALLAEPDWDLALWVLHGGTNRAVLSGFLAGPGAFFGALEQDPGCLNVIDVARDGVGAVVRRVNHTPLVALAPASRATTMEDLLSLYRRHRPPPGEPL